ncbi:MAG: hypothetical protein K9N23_08860 [Akkermansiaceae bacterium]|nr:hypothetical protein [Akkermansiaceae bacterium]
MPFANTCGTRHSLDHVTSHLPINARGIQRHDARGDAGLLDKAVERMWQRRGLDRAFNGVPRHHAQLPQLA